MTSGSQNQHSTAELRPVDGVSVIYLKDITVTYPLSTTLRKIPVVEVGLLLGYLPNEYQAEVVGFEPTMAFTMLVFKTSALNHSATLPFVDLHII